MDMDDFRTILEASGVDIWTLIDTAVLVASLEHGHELKQRRDGIVEKLYGSSMVGGRCKSCDYGEKSEVKVQLNTENGGGAVNGRGGGSPPTPPSADRNDDEDDDDEDEEIDPFRGLFDEEPKSVLEIKELLEDHDQPEDTLVNLLQSLADMDITFHALQETDIGRHVNRLRKHPSNEVRRIVKPLVRKWKEIVDEWVSVNPTEEGSSPADRDSSPQKLSQNGGHHQVPDFGYSPNLHNGMSPHQERNKSEAEEKPRPIPPPRKELPSSAAKATKSSPLHNVQRQQQKESFDADRLASARKRLQNNYKEAENAKKQRTIRVMDIHELPKPKKGFFSKGKPNGASHARQW